MAGIDTITNEILQTARAKADEQTAAAKAKAEELIAAAQKESDGIRETAAAKADADAASYAKRIESQAGMRKRQTLLKAKQDIIGEVIEAAYEKLVGLPDEEYFALLGKLIVKNVQPGAGELLLNAKDLKRMPESFAEEAEKAASDAGGTLAVSAEAADIANGFVLRYGGIEENCTLGALFAEKQDQLRDKVREVLW